MATARPNYEFGGPLGASAIVFGLPVLSPALLSLKGFSLETLKTQTPWPADGLVGFLSWKVTAWLAGYYLLNLVLYRILPAQETLGTKLRESGKPLKYRFNAFNATLVKVGACAIGTLIYGAEFPAWTFVSENHLQLLTGNIVLAFGISTWVYLRSFSVTPGKDMRELDKGGHTGNVVCDFYIGRELNPRVTLPFIGKIEVKACLEMRPGLTGWILLNCSFIAKQYRQYGYVSDSILIVAAVQSYYALEGQYHESGTLGMMDIVTNGLGFMLTFGDIVWVPFLYSTQCQYLSTYPVHLGLFKIIAIATVFSIGLFIFRSANAQKYRFRSEPSHPTVRDMPFIQTKRGTKLLTGGWWGKARHINYFGDWVQSLPFCLPTGLAGYAILPPGGAIGNDIKTMLDGRQVTQDGVAPGVSFSHTFTRPTLRFSSFIVKDETIKLALKSMGRTGKSTESLFSGESFLGFTRHRSDCSRPL